jgi:hypothetical protein
MTIADCPLLGDDDDASSLLNDDAQLCWLLKLRLMETHRVPMKEVLPWLDSLGNLGMQSCRAACLRMCFSEDDKESILAHMDYV